MPFGINAENGRLMVIAGGGDIASARTVSDDGSTSLIRFFQVNPGDVGRNIQDEVGAMSDDDLESACHLEFYFLSAASLRVVRDNLSETLEAMEKARSEKGGC